MSSFFRRCLAPAVGSLARAVLEPTAKENEASGRSLEARIAALREDEHIRKRTQGQAYEVRHFGNDMAHGDFVDPVAKEEAGEFSSNRWPRTSTRSTSPPRVSKDKEARGARQA